MTSFISHLPPWLVYLSVFAFVAAESLGVPVPGETALLSGALISVHPASAVSAWTVFLVGAIAAIVGDTVGYLVGRRLGPSLMDRLGNRFPRHLSSARVAYSRDLFRRKGMHAVFFGRFVALLRILAGPLAGTMAMPYRRFLLANASGAVVWSAAMTGVVVLLGAAGERWIARGSWVLLAVALVVAVIVALLAHRRLDALVALYATTHERDEPVAVRDGLAQ